MPMNQDEFDILMKGSQGQNQNMTPVPPQPSLTEGMTEPAVLPEAAPTAQSTQSEAPSVDFNTDEMMAPASSPFTTKPETGVPASGFRELDPNKQSPAPYSPPPPSDTESRLVETGRSTTRKIIGKASDAGVIAAREKQDALDEKALKEQERKAKEDATYLEQENVLKKDQSEAQIKQAESRDAYVKKELDSYQSKVDELSGQALEKRSFWATATTGEKLSSALGLLSAIAYTVARQPEQANKMIAQVGAQIDDTIKKDLDLQKANMEKARAMLAEKRISMGDKFKALDDVQKTLSIKHAAALTTIIDGLKLQRAKMAAAGQDVTALDRQISDKELQRAEVDRKADQDFKDKAAAAVTVQEAKTGPSPAVGMAVRDYIRTLPPDKAQAYAQQLTSHRAQLETKAVKGMYETSMLNRRVVDAIQNKPETGSILLSEFIATEAGLGQGSYNPQLAAMITGITGLDTFEKFSDWVKANTGKIPMNVLKNLNSYLDTKEAAYAQDPNVQNQYKNYERAVYRETEAIKEMERDYSYTPKKIVSSFTPANNKKKD